MEYTIFPVLILVALTFVGVVTIKYLIKFLSKEWNQRRNIKIHSTMISGENSSGKLALLWSSSTDNKNSLVNDAIETFVVERFLEKLSENFIVVVHSAVCWKRTYCTYIYDLTSRTTNQKFFIQFQSYVANLVDTTKDNRPNYFAPNGIFEGDSISDGYSIAHSALIPNDHPDIVSVDGAINYALCERIQYPPEEMQDVYVNRLIRGNLGYRIHSTKQPMPFYNNELLDLSYTPINFKLLGESHQLPLSKAMPILIKMLSQGDNIGIVGSPGTGKSTLMDIIQQECHSQLLFPVVLTSSIISEWRDPARLSEAIEVIQNQSFGKTVIFFLDEAETLLGKSTDGTHTEIQTVLLPLLSGSIRDTLNCATVLVFNADPATLNPAIFRAGRLDQDMLIALRPIPTENAEKLASIIRTNTPELVFDRSLFHQIAAQPNKFVDGTQYAGPNEIALADLYKKAFMPMDRRRLLLDAVRKAAVAVETEVPSFEVDVPSASSTATPQVQQTPYKKKNKNKRRR